jgi:hypothetical protein
MTQALYAHLNNKTIKKKKEVLWSRVLWLTPVILATWKVELLGRPTWAKN